MPIDAAPATGPALRPLAVGITPLETRRDVVLQVATRAEREVDFDRVNRR